MTQIFCNGNITLPLEDIFKELLFLNVTFDNISFIFI